ncbi:hypothetical protein CFOL_v3_22238 [Cephalotus follicularis]|uniref:Exo_endo_phos domain-containing protein n=1 Tax=Cephalotus follicularis TaxID=3775 RepID=A0A1Q3CFB4_CEPFO|nr:hypothetical protein CFOL_v3_22238 [Cephalotus follicularis]
MESIRLETRALLRTLHEQINMSWVCVGDFNEILRLSEKYGGALERFGI